MSGGLSLGAAAVAAGFGFAKVWVLASRHERCENGVVVAHGHGVVGEFAAGVVVCASASVAREAARWVVALHRDVAHHGVVVAILHVLRVPVDETARPVDGAFSVAAQTGGPQRQLHTRWRLWEVVAAGGGVPGVVSVQGAHLIAIDAPSDLVGRPIDGICVHVDLRVGHVEGDHVLVYSSVDDD